jgi:urea transport system ATP-binding protein
VGKTTLLRCLMGLIPSRSGKIEFDAKTITTLPPYARASMGLGYVPQGRDIFPRLTVRENLEMGLATQKRSAGVPGFIFEMFPVLKDMLGRRGGDLSGGQQQQLAIGRALTLRPKLLILDEPTEGIQPSIIKELAVTLRRIRDERGLSILVSEQVLSFALAVADRAMVLERGRIVYESREAGIDEKVVAEHLAI